MMIRRMTLALLAPLFLAAGCEQSGPVPLGEGPTETADTTQPADTAQPPDPADTAQPTDTTRPPVTPEEALAMKALSRSALRAWRAADVTTLAALSPAAAGDTSGLVPGEARFDAMFGAKGWRGAATGAWDGTVEPVRVEAGRALVRFIDLDGGQVGVVDLREEADGWRFYHLMRVPKATFEAFGSAVTTP